MRSRVRFFSFLLGVHHLPWTWWQMDAKRFFGDVSLPNTISHGFVARGPLSFGKWTRETLFCSFFCGKNVTTLGAKEEEITAATTEGYLLRSEQYGPLKGILLRVSPILQHLSEYCWNIHVSSEQQAEKLIQLSNVPDSINKCSKRESTIGEPWCELSDLLLSFSPPVCPPKIGVTIVERREKRALFVFFGSLFVGP